MGCEGIIENSERTGGKKEDKSLYTFTPILRLKCEKYHRCQVFVTFFVFKILFDNKKLVNCIFATPMR